MCGAGKKHTVSHDEKAGCTTVSHLETVDCKDPACVAALLQRAAKQRAVGATASNERSSRSHMVFTLSVRGARASDGQQLNGAVSLSLYPRQAWLLLPPLHHVL